MQAITPPPGSASTKIGSDVPSAQQSNRGRQVAGAKDGSKRATILALLGRKEGATINDLIAATGWLPHTTRAALSGLRKSGFAIVRTRDTGADASVYRIDPDTIPTTAAA